MQENTENKYIENWVRSNETRLTEIRNGNPQLYGAVNGVLNYLNTYLGGTIPIQEIIPESISIQPETKSVDAIYNAEYFKNTKIKLRNETESENFQKLLYDLGANWYGRNSNVPEYTKEPYLYVDKSLEISWGDDIDWFYNGDVNRNKKEIFYDEIFGEKIEPQIEQTPEIPVLNAEYFKNTKVRVENSIQSERLQIFLFQLGIKWIGTNPTNVQLVDAPFLFISRNLTISKSNSLSTFETNSFREIYYNDIFPPLILKEGDKVKMPKTRKGETNNSIVIKLAKDKNQDYLYVSDVTSDLRVYLSDDTDFQDEEMFWTLDDNIELYDETSEIPTPTVVDANTLQWTNIWASGFTPENIVVTYKDYVAKKGKIPSDKIENLITFFGNISGIIDSPANKKVYLDALEYLNPILTNPAKQNNIYRFVLKPEFIPIFKILKDAFKSKNGDFDNNGVILQAETLSDFIKILEVFMKENLLYNSLTIPDLIIGKKTNSIVVTQEEQSDFDDLLDELDNLEL